MKDCNSDLLTEILNSTPEVESKKIEAKMIVAAKIDNALQRKKWKKKDFLKVIGKKQQSLITKWLSGTHNFTIDTLIEMEEALGEKFLNLEMENSSDTKVLKANDRIRVYVNINREVQLNEGMSIAAEPTVTYISNSYNLA